MVYKKYIKRGNKLHGPYYYQSYRDENGKTKSRYLKNYKSPHKKIFPFIFLGVLIIFGTIISLDFNYTLNAEIVNSISNIISLPLTYIKSIMGFAVPEILPKEKQIVDKGSKISRNITSSAQTNLTEANATITTIQAQAVLGQPVKWKKYIGLEKQGIVKVKLPKQAKNITVNKIIEEELELPEEPPSKVKGTSKEKPSAPLEIPESKGERLEKTAKDKNDSINNKNITEPKGEANKQKAKFSITGKIISKEKKSILDFFKDIFSTIIGRIIYIQEQEEIIEVTIDDTATEYEIEYETPAPYATEEIIAKGKRITITGPENLHYENVLAFVDLSKESSKNNIRLYRTTDGIREQTQIVNYTDTNNNGLIDYIAWIVPHLSEQTYELIIEITKAEHLDSDRNFISDIYDEVKSLDDIWSETIPANDYVRVTFERNLTSNNDITVYPRIVSGTPRIEVYEVDGTEIIAEFTDITSNEYNKVFLTNLTGTQDVFDLRIVNGSLEFEHIVDPISYGNAAGGGTASLLDGLTWSHSITCGDNMILIVGISVDSEPTALVDTITYNGTSLSKIASNTTPTDDEEQAEMWNLTDPDCGTSLPVVVVFTNPTKEESAGLSAVYYGVDYINLSSVNASSSDGSTTSTLDVASSSEDNWVVNVFALDFDAGSGISVSGDNVVDGGYVDQGDTTIAFAYGNDTDGTVTMGWSGFNDEWVQIGVELIPAPPPPIVQWNQSNLDMGSSTNNITSVVEIDSEQVNTNVKVDCNGNCTEITTNWTTRNMTNGQTDQVLITCSNAIAGVFNATFNVTSDEDSSSNLLTVDCEIIPPFVQWNQSNLDMGSSTNNITSVVEINSTDPNTNVKVDCNGNCTEITTNWTTKNMSNGQVEQVLITCSNASAGVFNATFNVTSDEDTSSNLLTVDCKIFTYGTLDVNISLPVDNSNFFQNDTNLTINATVTCQGGTNAKCGTVSALARYNLSANPDTAINIIEGASPFFIFDKGLWSKTLDETVFNPAFTVFTSITTIDNDSVAISYNGAFVVYNINGTVELNETVFYSPEIESASITTIDNNSVAISYTDAEGDYYGAFVVYNINGTVELNETVFYPADTQHPSITTIDSDSVAISYSYIGGDGMFAVYNINGTVELNNTVFNSGDTYWTTITTIDNDSVAIAYQDAITGTFVVYNINGTVELNETVFNPAAITSHTSMTTIDNDSVAISYKDFTNSHYGTFVVYNINGSVELNETVFNPDITYWTTITTIDNDSVAIAYRDEGNNDYGTSVVYNINGTVELNETVFNPSNTDYMSITTIDNDSFAISYKDGGNSDYGTFVVYSMRGQNLKSSPTNLSQGESWNVSWTLNVTTASTESYLIDILFNSSYGNSSVPDNDTGDRLVKLNPSGVDETPPNVNLISPTNYQNLSDFSVDFNCSMTDTGDGLKNSTLYGNWSGWHANETKDVTGSSNSTTFTKNLSSGIYVWNCYVCDLADNCAFDSENYTFTVDTIAPTVNLVAPENNAEWNSSSTVTFTYNVSDVNSIENCSLIINGNINQTNSSITKDTNQTFNQTLADGNYNWSVNCTDYVGNVGASGTYNLTVNVSISISISLSSKLGQQINWTLASLPIYNQSAEGNNNTGITEYYVNISTEGTTADLYIKANDDLKTSGLDVLGLGNETYSYNITNASVPSDNKFSLTTNYSDNKIGENLNDGDVVYLKFFLSAPSGQAAGTYNNTLSFKAIANG